MRYFVYVFAVCQTVRIYASPVYWFINFFFRKNIFVCSYDNGAQYLSSNAGPFIYFHNVCMRGVNSHIYGGSNLRDKDYKFMSWVT